MKLAVEFASVAYREGTDGITCLAKASRTSATTNSTSTIMWSWDTTTCPDARSLIIRRKCRFSKHS